MSHSDLRSSLLVRSLLVLAFTVSSACGGATAALQTSNTVAGSPTRQPERERERSRDQQLQAIRIAVRRVHFALDSTELTPPARAALEQAAERLRAVPDVRVYVDGHTDERGTEEYNLGLGERRAATVVAYLVRLGIDSSRLQTASFGEEHPIANGSNDREYALNRRTELRLAEGNAEIVLENGSPVD